MMYDLTYEDTKGLFEKRMSSFELQGSQQDGKNATEYWLWDTDESALDERERLIFILPLLKYVVEHDILFEELKGEIRYYHREIAAGKFDEILDNAEKDEIISDVNDCYEKAFEKK